jgi:hypothetical protein
MTEVPKQVDRGAKENEEDYSWWGSKVKEFFLENPTLVLSLLYLYATSMGLLYSAVLYARFGINILDYAEISDFLLAAFKNLFPLLAAGASVLFYLALLAYAGSVRKPQARRDKLQYEASIRSNTGSDEHLTPLQKHQRFVGKMWDVMALAILLAISVVSSALFLTYSVAGRDASSIKDGETTAVDVRYRSFLSSTGQVKEAGLALIGATQKAVFFYDVDAKHTIVIPQAQIVSIEVPE